MADTNVEVTDETVVTIEVDPSLVLPGDEDNADGTIVTVEPGAKSPADEAAQALLDAQKRIDAERSAREASDAQARAERIRADEANRRAAASEEAARQAHESAGVDRVSLLNSEIAGANRDVDAAKLEYVAAHEAGDALKMADAQAKMSKAGAKVDRLEARKADLEANPPPVNDRGRVVEPQQQLDKFEQYLTTNNFDPAAASWLRNHRDCAPAWAGGDPDKNATMMEAHYAALRSKGSDGQKIKPNTSEYFTFLEQKIAGTEAEPAPVTPKPKTPVQQQQPVVRRAPPVAAPPSREANPGAPQLTTRNVKLNAAQQEAALISYPANHGEADDAWRKRAFGTYATEYVKAVAEGKIGRMTH
jgi:hypothetical protein